MIYILFPIWSYSVSTHNGDRDTWTRGHMDTWTRGHSRLAAVALQLLPGIVLPLIGTAGHAGKGKKWVWWQIFRNHHIQPFLLMYGKSTTCCIIYSIMSSAGISSGLHLALTSGQGLTGSCSFTHKGHQLLFNLLEGVQVIHKEDVPVTGFTGDAHQLPVVSISEANGKHDVTFDENSERERSMSPTAGKLEEQYERRLLHILKADEVWPSSNTDRSSRPSSELHTETVLTFHLHLFGDFVDVILRSTISEHHEDFGDSSSRSCFLCEDVFLHVLDGSTWVSRQNNHLQ